MERKSAVWRFGIFELDIERHELRRNGRRVRLQEHPFQVLVALVERTGAEVSREELRKRLWPDAVYLDFENGLNTAVAKLREALGDTASNPRFVETLPRRGYRFLAPVERPPDEPAAASSGSASALPAMPSPMAGGAAQAEDLPARRRIALALVAAAALLAGVLLFAPHATRRAALDDRQPSARFTVDAPPNTELSGSFAFSPDGRQLALVATGVEDGVTRLWLRPLDSLEPHVLADTEGAALPFWSPDGASLGFFAAGKLKTLEIASGALRVLADAPVGRGGSWNAQGEILFSPDRATAIFAVAARGGSARAATRLGSDPSHRFPVFLPDGRHFLYLVLREDRDKSEVRWGSLDSVETGPILAGASSVSFASPGFLLFVRGTALLARPFDAERLRLSGPPVPIERPVGRFDESGPTGYGVFSVSQNGLLAAAELVDPSRQMVWHDRRGHPLESVGPVGYLTQLDLDPRGERLAVIQIDRETHSSDLWRMDLGRGTLSRLTADPQPDGSVVWDRAGRTIAVASLHQGAWRIYLVPAEGGDARELTACAAVDDFSNDDERVVCEISGKTTGVDLWWVDRADPTVNRPLVVAPFNQYGARVSPDGRSVAYVSDESGRPEIFVQRLGPSGDRIRVSTEGGTSPIWRRDGRELYFIAPQGKLMAAGAARQELGAPDELFASRSLRSTSLEDFSLPYGVSPDGKRFLFAEPAGLRRAPIRIVLEWEAGLARSGA